MATHTHTGAHLHVDTHRVPTQACTHLHTNASWKGCCENSSAEASGRGTSKRTENESTPAFLTPQSWERPVLVPLPSDALGYALGLLGFGNFISDTLEWLVWQQPLKVGYVPGSMPWNHLLKCLQ